CWAMMRSTSALIGNLGDCFEFQDYFAKANKVGLIRGSEHSALVFQMKRNLGCKRNACRLQLKFKTLLIHCFHKPTALLFVHFKASAHNFIGFLFEQHVLAHSPTVDAAIRYFVYFAVNSGTLRSARPRPKA